MHKSIHLYIFHYNLLEISQLTQCIDWCIDDQLYTIVVSGYKKSFRIIPISVSTCFDGGNNLFLPWKQPVSNVETTRF